MMEHLNFTGRASQEELGRGLAQMHLAEPTVSPAYPVALKGHLSRQKGNAAASICGLLESPSFALCKASALLPCIGPALHLLSMLGNRAMLKPSVRQGAIQELVKTM